MYKLFHSRGAALLDALVPSALLPSRLHRYDEFWAVRGIDLEVPRGARVALIGRNGCGKTTLLKLATQALVPTEGSVVVNGRVHALIDVGAGFHPEFTGFENIRTALMLQDLPPEQIEAATQEIAEFTELGEYLHQPFKTYSLGMQSRLTFATATSVHPDILVIDEVLGAGDAYFLNRATERLRSLIDRGSALLLVSHSLAQVVQLCEHAVWIDRGAVVAEGPSLEIVKQYERFIRELENRRILSKNQRHFRGDGASTILSEGLHDIAQVKIEAVGLDPLAALGVGRVELCVDGEPVGTVQVGGAQDHAQKYASFVVTATGAWSAPTMLEGSPCRMLSAQGPRGDRAVGEVVFRLHSRPERVVEAYLDAAGGKDEAALRVELAISGESWGEEKLFLEHSGWLRFKAQFTPPDAQPKRDAVPHGETRGEAAPQELHVSRWPGTQRIRIERVRLLNEQGEECGCFAHGSPFVVELRCSVSARDSVPVIPVVVVYTEDGAVAFRCVGDRSLLRLAPERTPVFTLHCEKLLLGNGRYIVSVALYGALTGPSDTASIVHDLLDRSFEFRVSGVDALRDGVYVQPGAWSIRDVDLP